MTQKRLTEKYCCDILRARGYDIRERSKVVVLPPDADGIVHPDDEQYLMFLVKHGWGFH